MKQKIEENSIEICKEFAEKTWLYHKNQKRSEEQVKKDILVGKLSEIYARLMYEQQGCSVEGPFLEISKKPDGGWDLIVDGKKINVKVLYREQVTSGHHSEVTIKYNYDKKGGCEEYCLMLISQDLKEIEYYGSFDLTSIQNVQNIPKRENMDGSITQFLRISWFKQKTLCESSI